MTVSILDNLNGKEAADCTKVKLTVRYLIILPGFPTTVLLAGTDFVITLPAPTIAFSPMITAGRRVALLPILAPLQMMGP